MSHVHAFRHSTRLDVSAEEAFAWHERRGAFERLVPPFQRVEIISRSGGLDDRGRLVFLVRKGPVTFQWEAGHYGYDPPRRFCDEQLKGPFRHWRHQHAFISDGPDKSSIEDEIEYTIPFGAAGDLIAGRAIAADLERTFAYRSYRVAADLKRHALYGARPPLKIGITGASGLIGSALSAFLSAGGHAVAPMVRGPAREESDEISWNPHGHFDTRPLEGLDAVVHLAGENISASRWTKGFKERILQSRAGATRALCEALASLDRPPKVVVCASATGFYGDRGDEELDESSAQGDGFLADVCGRWEEAAEPARRKEIRVVHLRLGVVVAGRGGALPRMVVPFRLGLGGPAGDGRQWMSWISLDDAVGAFYAALMDESLEGAVNAVAPSPITNGEFARTLGKLLHRPALVPLPALAVKLALGEMGKALLLNSCRAVPARLLRSGFSFLAPTTEQALRIELGIGF